MRSCASYSYVYNPNTNGTFLLVSWDEVNQKIGSKEDEKVIPNTTTSQEGKETTFSCVDFDCGWCKHVDHGLNIDV